MLRKIKYFWQAFKCSWGYHDIQVIEYRTNCEILFIHEQVNAIYKCRFCNYKESFCTVEFKKYAGELRDKI